MNGVSRNAIAAAVVAALAVGAGVWLGLAGGLQPVRVVEFCALMLAAVAAAALATRHPAAGDRRRLLPSFVVDITSLLIFGPHATMAVVAAGAASQAATMTPSLRGYLSLLLDAATAAGAIQAAGFLHGALGGTRLHFVWPMQALPLAAALVGYCAVSLLSSQAIAPLLARQPLDRARSIQALRECSLFVVAAAVAVGIVEAIDHRMWGLLAVAAVPLVLAYCAYNDYLRRLQEEGRGREVIDSLDQGMAIVDRAGRVTLWNDALARMLGCSSDHALGRSIAAAVPTFAGTELPRAIDDVVTNRTLRTLTQLGLPASAGGRIFDVKLVPVADGATLLWHDVTDWTRAEQALKRSEERFTLAAEGANDGIWEWDLRTQELYFSGRWRAMLGLPAAGGLGRPEEWLGRVHPEDLAALKEALKTHLAGDSDFLEHEHRIRHEDGTYRSFLCRGVAALGAGRRPSRIAGSLTDTSDRAVTPEQLRSVGFVDPLTGLRNRADFVDGVGRCLADLKERRGTGRFAVLYLDLDRFKVVNDSLGHLVGDELLIAVSRRLEACLRPGDSLARLGGDEFAILLNSLGDEQQANAIAFRIQKSLSEPLLVGGREVFTSASIGIAFGNAQYSNPDEIMRDADTAMYHAKAHGKARHELFDADMHARERDRLGLESDLRHAVTDNRFEVHYQPIVSLATGMCVGFESLIRWTRNGEPVSPATFIPMAEELGLIEPIGTWVLGEACRTFADWKRRYPQAGLECITVNASSRQLMQQNFMYLVEQAVHTSGLKPADLRIEITETALMDSPHLAADVLRQLRDFGVKIYLDDFGTGYSSLSHLHKLPVDALKIDRSFVRSLTLPDRPAIVESILALARTLKTSVVAEGIETDVQASELERLGCTHAQGFLFSKPLSMHAVEELLTAAQPLGPKRPKPADATPKDDPSMYYRQGPFEWPDHIPVRKPGAEEPAPALMASASMPRTGSSARLPS